MVIDYLLRVESMDIKSMKKQEQESLVTILNYLGKRANNPFLLSQIKRNINRIHALEKGK
jgi:hypothetical protein